MVSITADVRLLQFEYDDFGQQSDTPTWFDQSAIENFSLDYQSLLDADTTDYDALFDSTPTTLGASLIQWQQSDTTLSLTGSGIGPISNIDELLDAVDAGVATGSLSQLSLSFGDTEVATLAWSAAGLTLTSGGQSLSLNGVIPSSLADIADFIAAIDELQYVFSASATDRADAIAFLNSYAANGLTISDGGEDIFSLSLSESAISISADTAVITLNGTDLPFGQLGDALDAAVQLLDGPLRAQLTDPNIDDLAALGVTSLDSLVVTVDGEEYLNVQGPITNADTAELEETVINGTNGYDNFWEFRDAATGNEGTVTFNGLDGDNDFSIDADVDTVPTFTPSGFFTGYDLAIDSTISDTTVNGGADWDYFRFGFDFLYPGEDYAEFTTSIDWTTGTLTLTDSNAPVGAQEGVNIAFNNIEQFALYTGGNVEIIGDDSYNYVDLDGILVDVNIDLGDGNDRLTLDQNLRFDEFGNFLVDDQFRAIQGYTRSEFLAEFDFTVDGETISVTNADDNQVIATITSVERLRLLTDRDNDGSLPFNETFSTAMLLAEENATDGVMTLNLTDGDDDNLPEINFSGQGAGITQFDINAGAGNDFLDIELNEGTFDASTTNINGGADYDTAFFYEDDYNESSQLTVDFANQAVTYEVGNDAFTANLDSIERVGVNVGGDVDVIGSTGNDTFRVDNFGGSLTFNDTSTDDTDTIELDRTRNEDGSRGLTLEEFTSQFALSQDATGTVSIVDIESEETVATLTNVEQARFLESRDSDERVYVTVAALLTGSIPTDGNDSLTGTNGNDNINGLGGDDTIIGLGGDDTLRGGDGNDSIETGTGDDRAYGDAGNDTIVMVDSEGSADGGDGDDTFDLSGITSGWGGFVRPGLGTNTLLGSSELWNGPETEGHDVSYSDLSDIGGVTITVGEEGTGTAVSGTAGQVNDSFTYFHYFQGSLDGDTFVGSDTSVRGFNGDWEGWSGLGGNDTLDGGGGFDELDYQNDQYYTSSLQAVNVNFATGQATDGFGDTDTFTNMEAVRGTYLGDTFTGSADLDFVRYRGLAGNDTITGADGSYDIVDYRRDSEYENESGVLGTSGIVADLIAGTIQDGYGDTDSVSSIDQIRGTNADDSVVAGDADLDVRTYDGNDTVTGGAGDDDVEAGSGNNVVDGGAGNDILTTEGGNDSILGGAGDDDIYSGSGTDTVDGGEGEDWLWFDGNIADFIVNDVDISDVLTNDSDYDAATTFTEGGTLTITTDDGSTITATGVEELIFDDEIISVDALIDGASGGDDVIGDAAATTDQDLDAGGGDDSVLGGTANDTLDGGTGNDSVSGGDGTDTLDGGVGDDSLNGGNGDDQLFDNTGDTEIEGGDGNDIAVAVGGNGTFVDSGTVTVIGNEINDFFCGGSGDDNFSAGSGNDIVVGDIGSAFYYGNDTLNGGADNDLLQGGFGQDVFVFGANDGTDTIARVDLSSISNAFAADDITTVVLTGPDFEAGVDQIHLETAGFSDLNGDAAEALALVQDVTVGTDTYAQFDHNGTTINFFGVTTSELSADDFVFV